MTTRYASLACADLLTSHQHQSYHHRLGNEILYNFACDLLGNLMMHMTSLHMCSVLHVNLLYSPIYQKFWFTHYLIISFSLVIVSVNIFIRKPILKFLI